MVGEGAEGGGEGGGEGRGGNGGWALVYGEGNNK